jgi:CDGSH-type Zn-finger protein/quercetin dioxygenase-like cupin family protein
MSDDQERIPRIARYKPYYFKPVPGKSYLWCSCGCSESQPFCDGSHKGTGFEPVKYVAGEDDGEVLLCGCKHTRARPFCDGSHNNLITTYESDDPQSESNKNKIDVAHHRNGRFELNGNCYVGRIGQLPSNSVGNITWRSVVTSATGSKFQAMFYIEVKSGLTSVISFGASEVILFVTEGCGEIEISGRTFALQSSLGIYIRQGEMFRILNATQEAIKIYVSACPLVIAPTFGEPMLQNFDDAHPQRGVAVDLKKAQEMADRSFQLLVGKDIGSLLVTQFIGTIPYSKAAPHRHLYEEALIVLGGQGMIWTEDLKTKVGPGDVVFLPSKQIHSLQCTDPEGMKIVGVIYPGGNPNINF